VLSCIISELSMARRRESHSGCRMRSLKDLCLNRSKEMIRDRDENHTSIRLTKDLSAIRDCWLSMLDRRCNPFISLGIVPLQLQQSQSISKCPVTACRRPSPLTPSSRSTTSPRRHPRRRPPCPHPTFSTRRRPPAYPSPRTLETSSISPPTSSPSTRSQ